MAATDTKILSFGESKSDSGLVSFILDPARNLDSDGKARSSFTPGTEVYLLLHLGPDQQLVRTLTTAGSLALVGWVNAAGTADINLGYAGATLELPQYPLAVPSAVWYGRSARLTLDGRTVTVSAGPVRGKLSYSYRARLYLFTPPAMRLSEDEQYPAVAWAETRKVS